MIWRGCLAMIEALRRTAGKFTVARIRLCRYQSDFVVLGVRAGA
jgi:hypothetical protein